MSETLEKILILLLLLFFAKVLINGLHSGTDRRGETKVVASFIVLISENRAK